MPQIPAAELPSVNPSGASGAFERIDAQPGAFGAYTAQGMQKVGEAGQQAAQAAQAINNEASFNKAYNQGLDAVNDQLYRSPKTNGPDDPGGYKMLSGEDAVNARDATNANLKQTFAQIRDGLNPAVQRQFDAQAMRLQKMAEGEIGSHYAQQTIVFNKTQTAAKSDLTKDQMLLGAGDPNDPVSESKWMDGLHNYTAALDHENQVNGRGSFVIHNDRNGNPIPPTDAARDFVDSGVSTLYFQRINDIADGKGNVPGDPVKASAYLQSHLGMITNPQQRQQLQQKLGSAVDTQFLRGDAQTGLNQLIGQPSNNAPLPAKIDGSKIPPYDQARISQINKFVNSPTPWDEIIDQASKALNVSKNEIKLKIAMESSGDPKAVNPQALPGGDHATGLGQFTAATAAQYGITDRTDPTQSIYGIARMLAANGGTVGKDMTAADRAYIGKGPDAEQYVENTRAARQSLYGPATPAPMTVADMEKAEAQIPATAQSLAAARGRGNDQQYIARQTSELHALWAQQTQALRDQDHANYTTVLAATVGPQGAKAVSQLSPQLQETYAKMSPESQKAIEGLMWHNQNEGAIETPQTNRKYLALMGEAQTDPVAFKSRNIADDIQDLPKDQQHSVMAAYVMIDKTAAQGANYQKALADLRPTLEMAKIRIPSANEKGDTTDYNVFAGKLKPALDNFMAEKKRQPTQQELDQIAAPLLANFEVKGGSWGGFASKTVPGYKLTPDQESHVNAPIPPADQQLISSSFQKRYGRPPQPAEAQQLFIMNKLHPGDRQAIQQFDQTVRANTAKLTQQPDKTIRTAANG